ncbi:solute carrier family 25 member 48 isoform X4 [Stegostoma tigrinum]|uniref:solute carrier family 25 member 48 isoform X4 n=1 Tax=Stegostoma tigrinum TaxID=3053191 RepID=UPI00286FFC2B|nr:solute carrier family 25 member 48 isoform X4 [Stegostoma tigrinum]
MLLFVLFLSRWGRSQGDTRFLQLASCCREARARLVLTESRAYTAPFKWGLTFNWMILSLAGSETRLQAGQGYNNTVQCVRTIFRNEHVAGFFKGLSFPLASIAVYNSVALGVYGNAQRFICRYRYGDDLRQSPALSDVAAASAVVALVTVGIGAPVDLVKIRLQMQTQPVRPAKLNLVGASAMHSLALNDQPLYRGPVHCISRILRTEGIVGLYRGVGAMYLRDVPGYCLYFVPYMLLCDWMTPEGSKAPNLFCVWLAGGVAGTISWGTATPMDVVKSRLQADGVSETKYKGIVHCIQQSYRKEGLNVFFKGATVNAIRGFPMSAAMFFGYELALKALRGQ